MKYYRPEFSYEAAEKARPRNKMQAEPPLLLAAMLLSIHFISLAAKLNTIYTSHPAHCTVEIAMIAFAFHFVQYEVDINNPSMIREFIDFFRRTLTEYAPRFVDEKGRCFINLNLGEIHHRLDNLAPILHLTAFATKECLMEGGGECVNHIDRGNHSILYHLYTTIADAIRSMTNRNLTPESMETIVNDKIAIVDTHTRSGTEGAGNSFPEFRDEVNQDPKMADFCTQFESMLKLDQKLRIGTTSKDEYEYCQPIMVDMLLGIFNLVLYAIYYFAVTKRALRVFIATSRTHVFFQTVGGNTFNALLGRMIIIGKGLHPIAIKANLTNSGPNQRSIEDVRRMDDSMAYSLEPLRGCEFSFEDDNGMEQSGRIVWGPIDSLQRTFRYRLFKKSQDKQHQTRKREVELKRELKRLEKKQEKLVSLNNKVLKIQARQDKYEKNRADAEAKRKEAEKEYAEVANKRTKRQKVALAKLLSSTVST